MDSSYAKLLAMGTLNVLERMDTGVFFCEHVKAPAKVPIKSCGSTRNVDRQPSLQITTTTPAVQLILNGTKGFVFSPGPGTSLDDQLSFTVIWSPV